MSQISQISVKDIIRENRMDAEFHRNIFINPKLEYDYIWNLLKKNTQYWISIDMNLDWNWYKIYRMNEIENMFCKTEVEKYANIEEKEMKTFKLNDRDVLFNRTNSYEFVWRTWIFKKYSDEDLVFASYLIRVNPDENKILPEYLTAFLNTKYWIFDVKRRAKISINQSNVSAEELKKVRIPVLDMEIQEKIKDLFDKAFLSSQKSKYLYQEAEDLLLTELWLKNHTISHTLTFSTTKKAVDEAWRYDADYFQPKYDELIEKIENYKWGRNYVENLFKQNLSVAKIDSETCNYVEIWDINISNWEIIPNEIFVSDLPANWKRVLKKNDLLISKVRPYRWAVSFIDFECENLIWSWAFTILQEKTDYKKEVLMVFLKTECIKDLLLRYNCGTSYPVIKDETILKLKLPLINPQLQKEISDKIKESFKLRNESKELLEQAKKMVEDEIEKE